MTYIQLDHIHKFYTDNEVISDFSYTFNTGELVGIFGPNGCGKTTLLHIISGLEKPSTGIVSHGSNIKTSYVFQDYRNTLFPWMTVEENIGYPLRLQGWSDQKIKKNIFDLLQKCNVDISLQAYPYMLSGGKQQLVNILRSIINKPDFLLLDEPFASLDYTTKEELYMMLQKIFLQTKIGIILVSHDIDELIRLSNKIILLDHKPLQLKQHITYDEAYPRDADVECSTAYISKKKTILTCL